MSNAPGLEILGASLRSLAAIKDHLGPDADYPQVVSALNYNLATAVKEAAGAEGPQSYSLAKTMLCWSNFHCIAIIVGDAELARFCADQQAHFAEMLAESKKGQPNGNAN